MLNVTRRRQALRSSRARKNLASAPVSAVEPLFSDPATCSSVLRPRVLNYSAALTSLQLPYPKAVGVKDECYPHGYRVNAYDPHERKQASVYQNHQDRAENYGNHTSPYTAM